MYGNLHFACDLTVDRRYRTGVRTHIQRGFSAADCRYRKCAALAAGRVDIIRLINAEDTVGHAILIADRTVYHQAHINIIVVNQCAVIV